MLLAVSACGDGDPRALDWSIVFADEALRADARLVEAEIRQGGCDGEVVWSATIRPDDLDGMRPPALEPGTWGFAARARDASCVWIAAGCEPAELGADDQPASVRTVLAEATPVAACAPESCRAGECGLADAGSNDTGTPDTGTPDAGPPDAGPSCDPADDGCSDGVLTICDAATGETSVVTCPLGCATTGEPRCVRLLPSNVDASLLDESLPDVSSTSGGTIDTTACDAGFGEASVEAIDTTYGACVVRTGALTLDGTWQVTGSHPLILLAGGAVRILGTIDLSARGATPGPGGTAGGTASSPDGEGPRAGQGGRSGSSFADGGGGGGGGSGNGGDGGDGGSSVGTGGAGGTADPTYDLEPLLGGLGGGAGAGAPALRGAGGAGGGALQISSSVSIELSGSIHAGGGGGEGGRVDSSGTLGAAAGGGGGSGGSVLLEAPVVTLSVGLVAASGGGGGAGANYTTGDGGDGADALGGTSRPPGGEVAGSAGDGGSGGAGSTLSGEDGGSASNGGGGGGAAGFVLVRNASGALPPATIASSPSADPGFRVTTVRTE